MSRFARLPAAGIAAAWLLSALLAGCSEARRPPEDPETAEGAARRVVEALAARDFATLAELVHPSAGVRFSPYATVDPERDVVLSADELRNVDRLRAPIEWGVYDGTGEPIRLSIGEYCERFVYDADFAAADEVARDRRLGYGNSLDNLARIYPRATVFEFHFEGFDPRLEGMDWRSLRLALEPHEGGWTLVGVVHDEWTT